MKPIVIYFLAWVTSTVLYLMAVNTIKANYDKWKRDWEEIRLNGAKRIRKIDLEEQYSILLELREIQEDYPNVSRHDRAMMNTIDDYIEKTARQLRYLDIKNESSDDCGSTDNP